MEELGFTAFAGQKRLASGSLVEVARRIRQSLDEGETAPIILFDDSTGRLIDLDLRGTPDEVAARVGDSQLQPAAGAAAAPEGARELGGLVGLGFAVATEAVDATDSTATPPASKPRGPGRPRLGVVAREVTLLPRHWEWLASQPGGASVTLRKLVEIARKRDQNLGRIRQAQEAAYRFTLAVAGDLPGFEEAARALFAWDLDRFSQLIAAWPADVRDHALAIVRRPLLTAEGTA
jgi:hypothetical protein